MGKLKKILIIIGMFLCIYPIISHLYSEHDNQNVIKNYYNIVEKIDEEKIQQYMEEARLYNETLSKHNSGNMGTYTEYENLLNPCEDGMIGVIEIPKIHLYLPVYHGTSESVMQDAIGHLYRSSLPVGGNNVHSVLTGHRGMPNAELFTRLGEVEEGDYFFVHIYDMTLGYQVCNIQVIRPEDTEKLSIQQGRDLVSLITCTPYGINTHRLVVTGERMEEKNNE